MEERTRLKVLFLAAWYPDDENPVAGIFIKKHAEAASRFCDVGVLHVCERAAAQRRKYDISCSYEGRIRTVRVRYSPARLKIPFLSKLRRLHGTFMGLKKLKEDLGRPDITHVNVADSFFSLAAVALKFFRGVPYVITEHNSAYTDENGSFRKAPFHSRFLLGLIFRHADSVTAVSDYLLRALKKNFSFSAERADIIPNVAGIPGKVDFEREAGTIRVLCVSMLVDKAKNLSGLIEAFSEAFHGRAGIVLDIVGAGPDRAILEGLARELGLLGKSVFFHGLVPNDKLEGFFRRANFFVLNSNYETFSVVTAEALAHGLPVLITECGGPQEFVTGEMGIIVKRKDVKGLAKGLELMASRWDSFDPAKLSSSAKEHFDREPVSQRIRQIYKKILAS